VEYTTGNSNSTYGALRAAAGHAEPFCTPEELRLEVGNEERAMAPSEYPAHYRLITSALWRQHPELTVVASGRWGQSVDGSPCLTGQRCDVWDDHFYRTPDQMASMGHYYDDYNRSMPDVFVGEFAANVGHEMTLKAAIAEAVFMLGFETNGDKVKSASFAPMLNNVNGTQWGYDLLNFDSSRLYALPSYYMQQMFMEAAGDFSLRSYLEAQNSTFGSSESGGVTMATAAWQGEDLVIKLASYSSSSTALNIELKGFTGMSSVASTFQVLTSASGPNASNTLLQPEEVVPTTSKVAVSTGNSFTLQVPAWSVAVLRLHPMAKHHGKEESRP